MLDGMFCVCVCVCTGLINMFLLNYPSGPCSVATFYQGQVLLSGVKYIYLRTVISLPSLSLVYRLWDRFSPGNFPRHFSSGA